jgi:nuclear pore complex protein Nup155
LGADGRSFNYVDQCTDARNQAASMSASSQQLTPNKFKIVSIHPTLPSESKKYQFVAITSTGCRLYFSHKPVNSLKEDSPPGKLKLEHTRVSADDITANDVFTNAYYKNAVFIGVKNQHDATTTGDSQIITYTPDLGALSNPHNILNKRFLYREFLNDIKVPGKIITLVETEASTTCKINELTASYEEPPRNFLALTTFGLVTFVKQRPIDMLCKLLALTNQDTAVRIQDFQSFCQYFGYINVVSLCLAIICCPFLISSDGANTVEPIPDIVVKGAKDLLVEFGQYPSEVEQQYTSRHDGLALYIYRVINPIWNKTLVKSTSNGASAIYTSNFSLTELQRNQEVLKRLANMMHE